MACSNSVPSIPVILIKDTLFIVYNSALNPIKPVAAPLLLATIIIPDDNEVDVIVASIIILFPALIVTAERFA
jgi:hypothetical protein